MQCVQVGGGVYTQLARQDRQYAARHLLEHHLMAGTKLSLATLAADQQLRAAVVRGPDLAITRSEDNLTLVTGHGVVARVVRGDIECTNGYIHLVDFVIMRVSRTPIARRTCPHSCPCPRRRTRTCGWSLPRRARARGPPTSRCWSSSCSTSSRLSPSSNLLSRF